MIDNFRLTYASYFNGKWLTPAVILGALYAYLTSDGVSFATLNAIITGLFLVLLEDAYLLTEGEE